MAENTPPGRKRSMPRWPLALIASPAAVAVWSGWVGLGGLCGFGEIHPLPGIWDAARLNTAITLPAGVESYGAYALAAWLVPGTGRRARAFAGKSALGALALGMAGQVAYHLLAAAHATTAPWPVTMIVACLPVATLAMATALTHLLRTDTTSGTPADRRPDTHPPPDTRDAQSAGDGATARRDSPDPDTPAAIPGTADQTPAPLPSDSHDTARQPSPRLPDRDVTDIEAQALGELSSDPDLSGAELARRLGIGTRRGQRLLGRLAGRLPGSAG
jgi:hypothetical protein